VDAHQIDRIGRERRFDATARIAPARSNLIEDVSSLDAFGVSRGCDVMGELI
jgi:hypothetical protein